MVLLSSAGFASAFSGGSGTSSNPYQIANQADLASIDDYTANMSKYYVQTANITLTGSWQPLGRGTITPGITPFSGSYDGNGYTINNLYIHENGETHSGFYFGQYLALFSLTNGATLTDIHMVNATINGSGSYVSMITTQATGGTVISECSTNGSVYGSTVVGGLVGSMSNSEISNCYTNVDVDASQYGGGLVGYVGSTSETIEYSYARGTVTGSNIGGVLGYNDGGSVTVTSSYYDYTVSGVADNGYGDPLTTTQMISRYTYSDWDFGDTWTIYNGVNDNYPDLVPLSDYMSGSGTSSSPYIATDINDVQAIFNDLSSGTYYELGNDIDATETSTWNSGEGFVPIGKNLTIPFAGNFNGNGYTIDGVFIYKPTDDFVGMFGSTLLSDIENVAFENINITGADRVGAIGDMQYSTLSRCKSSGTVTGGTFVGGMVGLDGTGSSILNSYSNSNISASLYGGGLVGAMYGTALTNCYSSGIVSSSSVPGGFVAFSGSSPTVTSSYWDTETSGQATSALGTGKTTNQMLQQSTYSGWNFNTIWDMQNYPALQFEAYDYDLEPVIITPANGTTVYTTYPPLSSDVVFLWSQHDGAESYTYSLAKDENYNTVVASGTTTAVTKTIALEAGDYWFRVMYNFNGNGTSNYTESVFTINSTVSDYGTAVQGVVYEDVSGSQVPLTGAKVTIYNNESTFSEDYITSSNGYYLFSGLNATTYFITASKDGYETSSLNIVTLTENATATKNIALEEENAPNYIYPHYVEFVVQSIWHTYYEGVTVNVYIGDSAAVSDTQVTGSNGVVGFELDETTQYRLTFYSAELGIDDDMTITPVEDTYNVYVFRSLWDYLEDDPIENEEIEVTVNGQEINSTHAYINVTYDDALEETTDLTIYITQSNTSDLYNQTVVDSHSFGGVSSTSYSFVITDYENKGYYVHVVAEHETFGSIDKTYSVYFAGMEDNFGWTSVWIWLAAVGLIFIAAMFGNSDYTTGALTVCFAAWIMYGMDWFIGANSSGMFISISLATIISVAAYINQRAKEEGT